MKKKKTTIRSHIILVTEGRLFTLIFVAVFSWILSAGFIGGWEWKDFWYIELGGIAAVLLCLPFLRFFGLYVGEK